ncbi:MAG: flavodoxin family protein [Fusobacterium gastrosuis]|uniref:flavodoxin family protein n=1 Tax=Fusobacterium TaxID=848 RepID=UPI0025C53189|nr:flavodoxin family protein [Fusobacterium sp.]MCI7223549.1 flavodoxin family protein [Fusobacterium sp.]MDD7392025.1 flavodoxin family protein [Fusobacteriaceae bacterium]MDY5795587.1 flavodoxin family protein [Fusobacterium gastrosuis]
MRTLIVYSTISGNTKAVCERIYSALNVDKKIIDIKNIAEVNLDEFKNIIIGFWCDKGTMDKDSIKLIKELKDKKIYFLGTLGARPESQHWKDVYENAKKLCSETNDFIDGLLIWGKISQAMMDMMMKFPKGHPHAPTSERIARWKDASTHPDENDFRNAEEFFKKLLND